MAQGDLEQARTRVEEILGHLETGTVDGVDEPFRIYLTCYRVLRAVEDLRAQGILRTAYSLLQDQASKIGDEQERLSFLESTATHREILSEFADAEHSAPTSGQA